MRAQRQNHHRRLGARGLARGGWWVSKVSTRMRPSTTAPAEFIADPFVLLLRLAFLECPFERALVLELERASELLSVSHDAKLTPARG